MYMSYFPQVEILVVQWEHNTFRLFNLSLTDEDQVHSLYTKYWFIVSLDLATYTCNILEGKTKGEATLLVKCSGKRHQPQASPCE